MKSNFGTGTNTIPFFLDDFNLLADLIALFLTQPIRNSSNMRITKANKNFELR